MTEGERQSQQALRQVMARLADLLTEWDFHAREGHTDYGHGGPSVAGSFCRGATCIHLRCYRQHLGRVHYEHADIEPVGPFAREQIEYAISHCEYMDELGHGKDCRLIEDRFWSISRDGSDPVDALLHDLREFAAPSLRNESPEFMAILRRGYGRRTILR